MNTPGDSGEARLDALAAATTVKDYGDLRYAMPRWSDIPKWLAVLTPVFADQHRHNTRGFDTFGIAAERGTSESTVQAQTLTADLWEVKLTL